MEAKGRPLKIGRSKSSYLVVAGQNVHVYLWWPWLGTDSTGFTVRWRRQVEWQHFRVILFQRNRKPHSYARERHTKRGGQRFLVRKTLTIFEVSTWKTSQGWSQRSNLKSYVRLKAGAGGKRLNGES